MLRSSDIKYSPTVCQRKAEADIAFKASSPFRETTLHKQLQVGWALQPSLKVGTIIAPCFGPWRELA